MKYKCPCCGFYTLSERPGSWEICKVCFWEDDPVPREDETLIGGANAVSLKQARKNYVEFGACEERFKQYVRPHLIMKKVRPIKIPAYRQTGDLLRRKNFE